MTGTGYKLQNFAIRDRRPPFQLEVAVSCTVAHQAVDLMEA